MGDWQNWVDAALAALLAAVLGLGAVGRRALRKRVGELLGGLVVSELAKLLAPVLAPLLMKTLRQNLLADVRQALAEEREANSEDMANALSVQRMALLADFRDLLRTHGATREAVEELRDRVAKAEGSIDVLSDQASRNHN